MVEISFFIIIILLFICVLASISKRKYSNKTLFAILFIYLVALCTISYNIIPGRTTDLYEHFYIMNMMKIYGFNVEYASGLHFIKILLYLISTTNKYGLLSLFSTFVSYFSFFFIFYQTYKKNEINCFYVFYILFCFFSLSSYYYIFTGIKSSLAFSFFSLAVFFNNSKKNKLSILFFILSIFSHGISLFLLVIYLLSKTKKLNIFIYIFPLFIGVITTIFSKINIRLIQYIVNKINLYVVSTNIPSSNLIFFLDITYGIILLIRVLFLLKQEKDNKEIKKLQLIKCILAFFIVGNLYNKLLIERGIMLISYFHYEILLKEKYKKIKYLWYIIDFLFCSLKIAYFYIRLISHVSFIL